MSERKTVNDGWKLTRQNLDKEFPEVLHKLSEFAAIKEEEAAAPKASDRSKKLRLHLTIAQREELM